MVVRKIFEGTLVAGSTSISFTDPIIPNSLIRVYSNDDSLAPLSMRINDTSVIIEYSAQTVDKYIALEVVKAGLEIIDALDSTADDKALSANQGKALNDTISNLGADDISYDNTVSGMTADDVQEAIDEVFTSVSSGKTLIAGAITDQGVPTSADDTFTQMAENIALISGGGGEASVSLIGIKANNNTLTNWTYTITDNCKGYIIVSQTTGGSSGLYVQVNGVTKTVTYTTSSGVAFIYYYDIGSLASGDVITVHFQNSGVYVSGNASIFKY